MSHLLNPSRCDTQHDTTDDHVKQSKTEREMKAHIIQLKKEIDLIKAEKEDLLKEASRRVECLSDMGVAAGDQYEPKKRRKSQKKEQIRAEWEKIDSEKKELEQAKLKLNQDRQLFTEEKKAFEGKKRTMPGRDEESFIDGYTSETMKLENDSSNTHEEVSMASDQEAPHGDAASPHIGETMNVASATKNSDHERSTEEEIQMADSKEAEDVECCKRSIAPVSSLTSHDAANAASPDWTQAAPEKAHIIGKGCGACGRRPPHASSPALRVRFLACLLLCIIFLAVGVAMSIVASLCMEETRKERNIWLEANGLTRAYLLATAPEGHVD